MLLFYHRSIIFHTLLFNFSMIVHLLIEFLLNNFIFLFQIIIFLYEFIVLFGQIIIYQNYLLNFFFQLSDLILQFSIIFLLLFVQSLYKSSSKILCIIDHITIFDLNLFTFPLIRQPQIFKILFMLLQLGFKELLMLQLHLINLLFQL
jgi:hypothetical protein